MFLGYMVRKGGTLVTLCGIEANDVKHWLCPRQPPKTKAPEVSNAKVEEPCSNTQNETVDCYIFLCVCFSTICYSQMNWGE